MAFRMTARRNKLVGQWAAEKMKLTAEETDAYARAVVHADFEEAGDDDVVRKLVGDLTAAGIETDDAAVRTVIEEKMVEARSEEHTSELQSLMRISYAVFCLKKKKHRQAA